MTACELLEKYDPAVRPFGSLPNVEKSKEENYSNLKQELKCSWLFG